MFSPANDKTLTHIHTHLTNPHDLPFNSGDPTPQLKVLIGNADMYGNETHTHPSRAK